MGPATKWVGANEVRNGDRIASRNVCGGFVGWLHVERPLDVCGCIRLTTTGGDVVPIPGERVEIAGDRS